MTDAHYLVRPAGPLNGEVTISGAKNSVLKLMAATLLAEGTHTLTNVPDITDVWIMAELLESLGQHVDFDPISHTLTIDTPATGDLVPVGTYERMVKLRASIVVLGALVGRCRRAEVAQPGGDDFGQRPIDYHVDGLEALGVEFKERHGSLVADGTHLAGGVVILEFPSHTATDNVLMAAVLAPGKTVIENAAREPEVIDLADMLNEMGARIVGAGTSRVEIEGVARLNPASHRVIPDRVEAATYLAATAIAGGEVRINEICADHMVMLLRKVQAIGVTIESTPDRLHVRGDGRLTGIDVATLPYPGVATDYQPLIVTMLAVAKGVSVVTENLYSGRFRYIDELRRMGADISTEGHHVVVRGVPRLSGAPVTALDIRAGVALVVAGLVAEGESRVFGASHIRRGYERIEEKLRGLGANIVREDEA
ncbi:MAG: UDP-N-acetylglucosamine 1-carboxyvinyltransferase [Acidimicrobiales bacterium]